MSAEQRAAQLTRTERKYHSVQQQEMFYINMLQLMRRLEGNAPNVPDHAHANRAQQLAGSLLTSGKAKTVHYDPLVALRAQHGRAVQA